MFSAEKIGESSAELGSLDLNHLKAEAGWRAELGESDFVAATIDATAAYRIPNFQQGLWA